MGVIFVIIAIGLCKLTSIAASLIRLFISYNKWNGNLTFDNSKLCMIMKPLLTLQGILELNALVCFSTQHVCFCFLFLLWDLLTVLFCQLGLAGETRFFGSVRIDSFRLGVVRFSLGSAIGHSSSKVNNAEQNRTCSHSLSHSYSSYSCNRISNQFLLLIMVSILHCTNSCTHALPLPLLIPLSMAMPSGTGHSGFPFAACRLVSMLLLTCDNIEISSQV